MADIIKEAIRATEPSAGTDAPMTAAKSSESAATWQSNNQKPDTSLEQPQSKVFIAKQIAGFDDGKNGAFTIDGIE